MERAVVIGGCGFLGDHLARDLLDTGFAITLADLRSPPPTSILNDSALIASKSVDFKYLDVTNADEIENVLRGADIVFHVASPPYSLNNK